MKIKIGNYKDHNPFFGLFDSLGFSVEANCKIHDFLAKINLIKRDRPIKVKVHDYDIWSADTTMGLIMVPLLKKFKESEHAHLRVDDEDVPEGMRSVDDPNFTQQMKDDWEFDVHYFARSNWVQDEIIWAFESLTKDFFDNYPQYLENPKWTKEEFEEMRNLEEHHNERLQNAFRLFGKYARGYWI